MIKPMIVKVANTGRTKIADSRASRLDCHEAGPKCAVAGRSRQSGEFTVLRVSGSRASPAVSFASTCGDSCVGHYRTDLVWGKIRDAWNANQGSQGKLGYPTADEQTEPDGSFKSTFEHGTITWKPGDPEATVTTS